MPAKTTMMISMEQESSPPVPEESGQGSLLAALIAVTCIAGFALSVTLTLKAIGPDATDQQRRLELDEKFRTFKSGLLYRQGMSGTGLKKTKG